MNDLIHLYGITVPCRIGVPAEERAKAQELVLDVTLRTDLRAAAYSESIADTVDYAQVVDCIHFVAGARDWVLIESLAETICATLLRQFPIAAVRLLLRKPEALRARGVAAAAVEIERFQPRGQRAAQAEGPAASGGA
ncbi:MAG: dihydroneopterin aldolase [Bryobacterales bacterium]|jgi:dihydroneopterin aldolase|nr:dihydroneopterin aldolase [Bryobacterales bacterium]